MKTSFTSRLLAFLIFNICAAGYGWAEDESRLTNDTVWTGNPEVKTNSHSTNDISGISPIESANSTLPSGLTTTNAAFPIPLSSITGHVATLAVSDLREYEMQPLKVQQLLASALRLTTLDLAYKYGSSDPKNGGMDCSGTVYYLLNDAGLRDVPRDASEMYKWVWTQSCFRAVASSNPDTFELARLKPGDLLFWTGTYQVDHDPPVTHVMIYLGINRHTGHRVMVGASEGRQFNGKSQYGVSVFDFTLPGKRHALDTSPKITPVEDQQTRFIGYGSIPGLEGTDGPEDSKN